MKKTSGFSLIEQLITLLVTSTAVLGVVKFQATMFDSELNSKQRAEAVSLAQQQLEILRSAGYDATAVMGSDQIQGTTTTFTRAWNVTPDPLLKFDTSIVTVTWATKGSGNTVSLSSRIALTSQADAGQFMLGQVGTSTGVGGVPHSIPATTSSSQPDTTPTTPPTTDTGTPSSGTPSTTPASSQSGNTSAGQTSCSATTLSGGICSYVVDAHTSGWAGVVSSTTSGYIGSATASCSNGQWALSGIACTPLPATCSCTKSRHGQSYFYSVSPGQDSRCTIAVCSAAPNQCSPSNNTSCGFSISVSQ